MMYEVIRYKMYNNVKIDLENWYSVKDLVEDNVVPLDIVEKMYKCARSGIEAYWFEHPEKRVIPSKNHPLVRSFNKWSQYDKELCDDF